VLLAKQVSKVIQVLRATLVLASKAKLVLSGLLVLLVVQLVPLASKA
jgi:hypothetical protein